MTARPEDQPLPLDRGHAEKAGRPPRDSADDGKRGGQSQGGKPGAGHMHREQTAPGLATGKKVDDAK
ncbi:hypothetical protein KX816_00445 [Sphingosinicellaceae bacterium]|nr:hypothetical protein KX816_00445 [Sphingosinicellaceae bacterium]